MAAAGAAGAVLVPVVARRWVNYDSVEGGYRYRTLYRDQ
jgi:hypothetical protein